ncbi:MAG TPA: DUF1501 domain-containing protein [Verrucomicrobiales bacterium]|nr:DUF1501 domain-containing protein [Verrucomicrobiales bacterium]
MFQVESGLAGRYCDGIQRRHFLQIGVAGMASAGLGCVLRAASDGDPNRAPAKDTSVILLWLDGGPSHMDLYDLKPEAPGEYRGIWRPIKTNVPGIEISELFPLQAKIADRFSIVRSLYHDDGDHFGGAHRILTGRSGANGGDTSPKYPGISAIAAKVCGPRQPGIPAHIAVPYSSTVGIRPGYFGGNYLGRAHGPFETGGSPNADDYRVADVQPPGNLTLNRLEDRRNLRLELDRLQRRADVSGMMETMDRFDQRAYDLVTGRKARQAFELGNEDPAIRDLYGRNDWGQSALLAARLVEAGSTFVTVHLGGWDHHWNLEQGMKDYLPRVDAAIYGLFTDLSRRGLYDKTLVVVCGEFSRTPKMNDGGNGGPPLSQGTPGRDHWGHAMFCLLGGGGIQGGRIVGATDRLGERPSERPVTPHDIHQTIYHVLGVDPASTFLNHAGRPIPAVDGGAVIRELL